MLSSGQIVTIVPEKPVVGGRMLARVDGEVLLVEGGLPNERANVRIDRRQQGVWLGSVVDVLERSEDRRDPGPDPACGGMTFAHVAYERQCELKVAIAADALGRIARIPPELPLSITPSPEQGYRCRYRLHRDGQLLGFFREATHQVCDPAPSGQLAPESLVCVREVQDRIRSLDTSAVQAFEFMENVSNGERVVNLALRPGGRVADDVLAALVGSANLQGISSTTSETAEISGRAGRAWVGDPVSLFTGTEPPESGFVPILRRHAPSFFQANRFLVANLARAVAAHLVDGPVVDLYAGVGLFAVSLAASGRDQVLAIEHDARSLGDLRWNAKPFRTRLSVLGTSVEAFLSSRPRLRDANLIVDPPRTGISRAALSAILAAGARHIVYVSCDVATFARDARRLLDTGYALGHLEAFDLFPNTAHVEVMAVFGRQV